MARILRPHGRRGEVACEILSDFPQRFKNLKSVELPVTRGRAGVRENVASAWSPCVPAGSARAAAARRFSFSKAPIRLTTRKSWSGSRCRFRSPSAWRFPPAVTTSPISSAAKCANASIRSPSGEPGAMIGHVRDVQMTGGTPILVVDAPQRRAADSPGAGNLRARGHRGARDRRGASRRSPRFEHVVKLAAHSLLR